MIGTVQQVLVESVSPKSDKEYTGKTRNNTQCVFPGTDDLIGDIVKVKIIGNSNFTLKGTTV